LFSAQIVEIRLTLVKTGLRHLFLDVPHFKEVPWEAAVMAAWGIE